MSLFGKAGEQRCAGTLCSHHCAGHPWVKNVVSEARARVAAGEERGPRAAPQILGLFGTWQAGFLAALTHFPAWFVSGEKRQASEGCWPHSVGRAEVPGAPRRCLIFSTLSPVGLQTWIVCVKPFQHDQTQSPELEQSLASVRRNWCFT